MDAEDKKLLEGTRNWATDQCVERAHEPWTVYRLTQLWEAADDLLRMFEGRSFSDVPSHEEKRERHELMARELDSIISSTED